jgi:AGZA family xanthine/uracil permease-like MFS transporter
VATCQVTDGAGTMIGALFGSPFPTTAYIGHPAYKHMGAHSGYIIGVGLVIPFAVFFGLLAFLNNLIPVAAAAPVLVFVALSLITNTAHSVKTEHMAAVTIAMMPHISAFLMIKWGSIMGALAAVGAQALPELGDPALTAALLQQGAHFEGHLALSQGAILTGLIWGAIVASVIDGNFRNAGGFALAACGMSLVGVIHSASLHWPEFSGVAVGYLIAAGFLYIYPIFHREEMEEDHPLVAPTPKITPGE